MVSSGELSTEVSRNNYRAYLWHAIFLSLAHSFMDVDTVLPAMMLDAGGSAFHVGLLTAIMIGGPTFSQLFFSPFIHNQRVKKPFLLSGIGLRTVSLIGMGFLYSCLDSISTEGVIWFIFLLLSVFSFGGAFAAISYTDILGKSVLEGSRKSFFSIKQSVTNVGLFISAYIVGKILVGIEYPTNYSWLFIIAGISLATASFGFFRIKEVIVHNEPVKGFSGFIDALKKELKQNNRLRFYILMVNTLGVSLSLLPFIMMYLKQKLGAGSEEVGQFLLFKVATAVITGLVLYSLSKRIKYNHLMYFTSGISLILVLVMLTGVGNLGGGALFLLGGVLITSYKVANDGVLMEVSSVHNRSLYAGFAGIGNMVPAIFPILGGIIVYSLGFVVLFSVIGVLLLFSIYFIYRLDCQK